MVAPAHTAPGGRPVTRVAVMRKCKTVINQLLKHEYAWVFSVPVDPVALQLHNYFDVIKNPMDLGTVKKNLDQNKYQTKEEFAADVRLVFDNAQLYNAPDHDVYLMAGKMRDEFELKYLNVPELTHAPAARSAGGARVPRRRRHAPTRPRRRRRASRSRPPQTAPRRPHRSATGPRPSPLVLRAARPCGGRLRVRWRWTRSARWRPTASPSAVAPASMASAVSAVSGTWCW